MGVQRSFIDRSFIRSEVPLLPVVHADSTRVTVLAEIQTEQNVSEVSRRYKVGRTTIYRWIQAAQELSNVPTPTEQALGIADGRDVSLASDSAHRPQSRHTPYDTMPLWERVERRALELLRTRMEDPKTSARDLVIIAGIARDKLTGPANTYIDARQQTIRVEYVDRAAGRLASAGLDVLPVIEGQSAVIEGAARSK